MPNWCDNTLRISHPDPAIMEKAAAAWNDGKFLATFVPEPDYPEYSDCEIKKTEGESVMPDWWNWRIKNWGTKWDIGFDPDYGNSVEVVDGEITVKFLSAWSPPIQAYDSMMEQGFSIKAYYFEPGCDFCGRYEDGIDDCYTASDGNIPEDIDRMMAVSETLENYNE